MANNSQDFTSLTGKMESEEPAGSGSNTGGTTTPGTGSSTSTQKRSTSQQRQASTQSTPAAPQIRKQRSNNLMTTTSPSAGASPQTSRNTSPIRKDSRPTPLNTPISTQPSAAAIQRALSAANVPQLQSTGPVTDAVSRLPRASKSAGGGSGDTTPQWPMSPRLKSPPPSASSSRRGSAAPQQKKPDVSSAPIINVQRPSSETTPPPSKGSSDEPRKPDQQLQAPAKAPSRGPSGKSVLETVQENSADTIAEPSAAVQAAADLKPLTKIAEEDKQPGKQSGSDGDKHTQPGESGSESAGSKADLKRGRRQSLTQPSKTVQRPSNTAKSSYAPLSSAKSRQPEGKANMTVETETVSSIPQSALNAGDRTGSGRNDNSGSVRLKPSNETIRPKKERKKPSQKTRSINQGTASSKADIFEARVASAVADEANSSDSDETFVYESNPPEPQRRPRHHSRTPSVTSAHSTADGQRGGIRNFGDMMDERRVAGKRSMKFSNNPYNDVDSPDSKGGTVRSHQARHFGKFGRGGSHTSSMFDPDSPFTQASKFRTNHLNTRGSRPNSPRSPQSLQQQRPSGLFGRKQEQSFDFDGEGADDERTPLVGSVRTPRSVRHSRHPGSGSVRSIDEYYGVRQQPRWGRLGGCLLGFCVLAAVILSAVAFLVMSNRPMYDVEIRKIQNVLASEQEIMLDLLVGGVNPNPLGITVTNARIDVFVKSKHVGSGLQPEIDRSALTTSGSRLMRRQRRRSVEQAPANTDNPNPWQDLSGHWHSPSDGVDRGTDPPNDGDLGNDEKTMLLGRITHFDQALSFEGSPIKRHQHFSLGEMRLLKPGNKTDEPGGSAHWARVLQDPFELIVRGQLIYQLPVSMREQTASVIKAVMVHPEDGVDKSGNLRVTPIYHKDHWQWIDWEDLPLEKDTVTEVEEG